MTGKIELFRYDRPGWCGPGHAQMTLRYFGIDWSLEEIARRTNTDEEGTDIDAIRRLFWSLGLVTEGATNLTWEDLHYEKGLSSDPLWVNWWNDYLPNESYPHTRGLPDNHYSLVKSVGENVLELYDGLIGDVLVLTRDYWLTHWRDSLEADAEQGWAMRVREKGSPVLPDSKLLVRGPGS